MLGILTRACWNGPISFESLLKHIILAAHHDFHWLLVATKIFSAKLHAYYAKQLEAGILKRSESDISPPNPQPWNRFSQTVVRDYCTGVRDGRYDKKSQTYTLWSTSVVASTPAVIRNKDRGRWGTADLGAQSSFLVQWKSWKRWTLKFPWWFSLIPAVVLKWIFLIGSCC